MPFPFLPLLTGRRLWPGPATALLCAQICLQALPALGFSSLRDVGHPLGCCQLKGDEPSGPARHVLVHKCAQETVFVCCGGAREKVGRRESALMLGKRCAASYACTHLCACVCACSCWHEREEQVDFLLLAGTAFQSSESC